MVKAEMVKAVLVALASSWCIATWFVSGRYTEQREESLIAHEFQAAQSSADSISANISRQITLTRGIPIVMALEPWLVQQLSTKFGHSVHRSPLSMAEQSKMWLADPQLDQLTNRLQVIVDRIGLSSLFVMNAAGDCVAEGHSAENIGFTGANYADREYFIDAQKGLIGHQFAVGRVTNAYALFYSAPVMSENQFVGAVATRINLDKVSQSISEKEFFITDENGVIVLAKDSDLLMRAVPSAKIFEISNKDRAARYKRQQFATLELLPFGDKEPAQLLRWKNAQRPYVLATQHTLDNLVTIYVLKDLEALSNTHSERIWWFSLSALTGLAILLLLTGALLFLKKNRAHFQELSRINELLAAQANTDALTGCANRRHFLEVLDAERHRWHRYAEPFSLLALDLDHFKQINDRYGHPGGDLVLCHFVAEVEKMLRPTDLLGRMGGEEFSVLLTHVTGPDAAATAERIRAKICGSSVLVDGETVRVTVSIGMAHWQGHDAKTIDDLPGRSDKALYSAKNAGRNQVHDSDTIDSIAAQNSAPTLVATSE